MYELFLALPAQLSEAQVKAKTKEIEEKIQAISGKLKKTFDLGRRPFAYPIIRQGTRHNEGYYLDLYFETDQKSQIKQLEDNLRLDSAILRFLIINQPGIPQKHPLQAEAVPRPQPSSRQAVKAPSAKPEKGTVSQEKLQSQAAEAAKPPRPSEKKKVGLEKFDEKLEEILEDKSGE